MNNNNQTTKAIFVAVGLALLVIAIFFPVTHFGFVNYDDPEYVLHNSVVQSGINLKSLLWAFARVDSGFTYWHPLSWCSHMLDCELFGLNAGAHHAVNVIFHAANAVILFFLLRRMTGALWRSAIVSAIFAVHPLQVDTVAWITERKNVLSTLLWLLTLMSYVRYTEVARQLPATGERRKLMHYGLTLVLFALGLMAKPMLVTIPCVLLILDFWPLNRFEHFTRRDVLRLLSEKLPFFVLAAVSAAITIAAHRNMGLVISKAQISLPDRVLGSIIGYSLYFKKLIWPTDLAVFYPRPVSWATTQIAFGLLFVVAMAGVMIKCYRTRPFVTFGLLWFFGTLVPVIGILQVGDQLMADRFTYVPMIGLLIAVVWAIRDLIANRAKLGAILSCSIIATLIPVTSNQLTHWKDSESLFRHAALVTENNFIAHYNLGCTLLDQGRLDEALAAFEQVDKILPNDQDAHSYIGQILSRQQKHEAAVDHFKLASIGYERLRDTNRWAGAEINAGEELVRLKRNSEALTHFEKALALDPENPIPHNEAAWILATGAHSTPDHGRKAVSLALTACKLSEWKRPAFIGTLDAAYACAGYYNDAIGTAAKVIELADKENDTFLAQLARERLALYKKKKRFRTS